MLFKKMIEKAQTQTPEDEQPVAKPGMEKWRYCALAVIAVGFTLFQLYIGLIRPFPPTLTNPIHLAFALVVTCLLKPLADTCHKKSLWIPDFMFAAMAVFVAWYFITEQQTVLFRIMMVDPMRPVDIFCSAGLLIILLEAVRRTLGLNLFIFILCFIAYAFFGQFISGPLRFSGMSLKQFFEMLTLTPDGIFGAPLTTSANSLFYFLLFGAFFATCGGGNVLIDLGMKLSDKTAGGPAKAAVVSSGLMGMISGSAVANVTTTGVLTIPLMKKAGYTPEQAGAVEAVASTGGQIMPPIMGVGAFIMAEMLGIPYTTVALGALIPALGYYFSIFMLVHFLAKREKMKKNTKEMKYTSSPIFPRFYRLLPIFVVVAMIFLGYSLTRSAVFGIATSIITSAVSKQTRLSPKKLLDALLDGVRQAAGIAIPTAACGIMIGIVIRSGAANKLTTIIASVGGSNIAVALCIAMLGCLLLGMALPTVAAYLISNILFCPTIIKLGIPAFPANMFVFYFGVIAQITPPVCLASFTAAGIAQANSWKTGWTAFSYAFVVFLTPYVFVFHSGLLLMGTVSEIIIWSSVMALGIVFLAAGMSSYCFTIIHSRIIRGLLILMAILTIIPEDITTVIGLFGGAIIIIMYFVKSLWEKKLRPADAA
ncbi:MAG: TRAP transporter fused permease subunit [Spirochaetales bacterium]|jgi:TRAP transporter 4TM/12TM fusion protein|nr:TRAP transporter fused permease subunit [Spirochaetales bacterium]